MFCFNESTGLRPVMISKRRTPNAKTSIFSSTIPCMKYSGARYPNVPSIGITAWWVHLLGSHFASPKSVIYTRKNYGIKLKLSRKLPFYKISVSDLCLHLGFIIWPKKDIWSLYVTMYYSMLTTFMKIMQTPCNSNDNLISNWPLKWLACFTWSYFKQLILAKLIEFPLTVLKWWSEFVLI